MADVEMPQLGETVTEGTITKWFKNIGDPIAMDETLFEVSTDKVDSEVPSPVAGFLAEIRAAEGDTVDVGTVIAVVSDSPVGDSAAPAPAADAEPEPAADAEPEPAAEPEAAASPEPEPEPETETETEPVTVEPRPDPTAAAEPPPSPAPAPASTGGAGALVSPVVRKLIQDNGLDVKQLTGTGVGGRVTRADVEQAIAAGGARPPAPAPTVAPTAAAAAPPAPASAATPSAARPAARSGSGDTVEHLNNIRRRTGEHMVMSKNVSPHAMTAVEVDYENVERVRRTRGAEFKTVEGFTLTYLPFISRAVIDALHHFPHMNATVGDGELIVHNYVNLSIAVDLNFEGLLAPVIHGADDMRLRAIARSINNLATRARTKKLSADDITDGTFTLSNSGSFGTHMVIPIINQPQVGILSTDGIARKPVVVNDVDGHEAIAIHSVGVLALSWDHRAFDGAYAAAFMREVKEILETRDWDAELA